MALFGSDKTTTTSKKIRPTVIRTQTIAKDLMNIAKSNDVGIETLDFNILETQTFTRMNDGTKETDWEEIEDHEAYELDEKTALLNAFFQIKQMYEIEVFSKNPDEDQYRDFHLAIGANATKCKIYLSIKAGSKVTYNPRFERELLILINKNKARAGILINIFDEMLSDAVSKISAHVRVEETVIYDKNETILIAQSYEPLPTTNDEIILHYDKKEEINENDKVDYSQRGFIKSILKDELLIEYIKAKEGKAGRNCRGEFIKPEEPIVKNEPTFQVDDTIKVHETDDKIEYFAKESGYIALEGNVYLIKTEVDIGEISFKTTGSITSGLDSDVSISVTEKDAIKDAIGMGMDVEVTEIDVEGNVGSNANVRAIKARVQGQTHKTATIRANELNINIHKGNAFGKDIHITRLEHGVVDGDIVDVAQAVGGDIRAKEITIELCGSYVNATASRFIEIKKMQGSENVFTIDPLLKKDTIKGHEENQDSIKQLEDDIKKIHIEIDKYSQIVKNSVSNFNILKKKLLHYQKNGVKMPESFVKQYKQYKKTGEHLSTIKKEYAQKRDQHTLLTTRTASFQDNIFDARIINRDRWVGYNEIVFQLVEPPIKLSYLPPEGSMGMVFGLVEVEEGEYEIRVVKE